MWEFEMCIEGLAPLKMNRFSERAAGEFNKKFRTKGNKSFSELQGQAKDKIYSNEKGIFVRSKDLKASGLQGAKEIDFKKLGRIFRTQVFFSDSEIFLLQKNNSQVFTEPTTYHFDFVRRPPKTGTLQPDYWPVFRDWMLIAQGYVFNDDLDPDVLKNCFSVAGRYYGVLDGRPDWGRYDVKYATKRK